MFGLTSLGSMHVSISNDIPRFHLINTNPSTTTTKKNDCSNAKGKIGNERT